MLADHVELFEQISDIPGFKKWLADTIFSHDPRRRSLQAQVPMSVLNSVPGRAPDSGLHGSLAVQAGSSTADPLQS
jgi:hypothetical protein